MYISCSDSASEEGPEWTAFPPAMTTAHVATLNATSAHCSTTTIVTSSVARVSPHAKGDPIDPNNEFATKDHDDDESLDRRFTALMQRFADSS